MSSQKNVSFPQVRTVPEFKGRVFAACASQQLSYSTLVTKLLEQWLSGNVDLEEVLDRQFSADCTAALDSSRTQRAFRKLAQHHDPRRTYPDALEA